jgi:hypothetical protein
MTPFRLTLSMGLGVFYESLAGPNEYRRGRRMVALTLELATQLKIPICRRWPAPTGQQ